jgi:hypothetical protein
MMAPRADRRETGSVRRSSEAATGRSQPLRAPRWGADVYFLLHPGRRTFARGYDECPHSGGANTRNLIAYWLYEYGSRLRRWLMNNPIYRFLVILPDYCSTGYRSVKGA